MSFINAGDAIGQFNCANIRRMFRPASTDGVIACPEKLRETEQLRPRSRIVGLRMTGDPRSKTEPLGSVKLCVNSSVL